MTREQVLKVVRTYKSLLEMGGDKPELADFNGHPAHAEQIKHLLTMCDGIERMLQDNGWHDLERNPKTTMEKIMRWLGFMQGVFWAQGMNTLNELMEHNAPGCDPK